MKKLNIKKILHIIIHTGIALLCVFLLISLFGVYRWYHHGYDSSEETIRHYIDAWTQQSVWNASMCFNTHDANYNSLMDDTYASFNPEQTVYKDNIRISTNMNQNGDILANTKASTTINSITSTAMSEVIIPYEQMVNDSLRNMENTYYFKTFEENGKWFIQSFMLVNTRDFGQVGANTTADITIGSPSVGYIPVPGDWTDAPDIQIPNSIETITSIAPYNLASISVATMDGKQDINDAIKTIQNQNPTLDYTIDTNATINNHKCTTMVAYDDKCTMVWIFKSPLTDSYIHIIQLICPLEDAEHYCLDYIQSYTL